MASNETNSLLEALSTAARATTKLVNTDEKTEELTPEMLASAIKLAALSTSNQEKLTPATVNAAIKLSQNTTDQEEKHENLTPESLAIALKLATKVSSNDNDNDNNTKTDDASTDQMLAAMKAAIAMTQQNQSNELVTPEILSNALELAKK